MNIGIYYFSGTGNSLRIARGLKERLTDTELIPVIPLLKSESIIPEAKSVGIVFPIQSFSYPWVVTGFLGKLDLSRVDYIFAISSSHCFFKVFRDLEKLLLVKRKFDAYYAIEMPQNYIPMFNTPSSGQVEEADRRMEDILDSSAKVIIGKESQRLKDSLLWFPLSNLIFPLFTGFFRNVRLPDMGRSFYTDDKCNGCRVCEKVCLADRIEMVNGRPHWIDEIKCTYCFAYFTCVPTNPYR